MKGVKGKFAIALISDKYHHFSVIAAQTLTLQFTHAHPMDSRLCRNDGWKTLLNSTPVD
jgi:hypothetical protein